MKKKNKRCKKKSKIMGKRKNLIFEFEKENRCEEKKGNGLRCLK